MVRLPTRRSDWRLLARTVKLVLGIPMYAALASLYAVTAVSVFAISQNLALVRFLVTGPLAPADRARILLDLYPLLGPLYRPVTGIALVGVAVLVGVDLALVTYHVREHGLSTEGSSGSAVGVFLGVLGAGCAACGSAVLVGLLSLVGGAGLVTLLPLEGLEFTILAAGVLVLSLFWLADGMRGGEIRGCPVDGQR